MLTIVVVEDEPLVRLSIEDALVRNGYSVLPFENSLEAIAGLVKLDSPPACLIVDLRLPGVSGWDVARTARQAFPSVPVLYTTGGEASDLRIQAVPNSDYLHKPFTEHALMRMVENLVSAAARAGDPCAPHVQGEPSSRGPPDPAEPPSGAAPKAVL